MIEALLRPLPIYVRIHENRLVFKLAGYPGDSVTIIPKEPFTTKRLLIGRFTTATEALKRGFAEVSAGRRWFLFVRAVIHPKEKIEGGLSEVEMRLFQEIAEQAGATKVIIWTGHDLSDTEVRQHLNGTQPFDSPGTPYHDS